MLQKFVSEHSDIILVEGYSIYHPFKSPPSYRTWFCGKELFDFQLSFVQ